MAASIIANESKADTATAAQHIRTLTEALGKIQEECESLEYDSNQALYGIEESIRKGEVITRSDLKKAEIVINRFDSVAKKLEKASTDGWVSLQLLTGKLWRAPNGDLVDAGTAGATSEAIV